MTYQTAAIVARSIDPEGFDSLDILRNGTGYIAYYTRDARLRTTAQTSSVRNAQGEVGLVLDRAGAVVAQGVADAMLGVNGGFEIIRQDASATREQWTVKYAGSLVTIFAEPEDAVDFVAFCVTHGIADRATWLERVKANDLWAYISKARAGADLAQAPFVE